MSFYQKATSNLEDATNNAILNAIIADPEQTIGSIIESLENDAEKEGQFLVEAFHELTVGQIVQAGIQAIHAHQRAQELGLAPPISNGEVEVPVAKTETAPPKSKPNAKRKSPPKAAEAQALDLSTPEAIKKYEKAMIDAFKRGGHTSKADALSAQNLRKVVGGSPDQARSMLNHLIEAGRAKYHGKARGTKYWLFA